MQRGNGEGGRQIPPLPRNAPYSGYGYEEDCKGHQNCGIICTFILHLEVLICDIHIIVKCHRVPLNLKPLFSKCDTNCEWFKPTIAWVPETLFVRFSVSVTSLYCPARFSHSFADRGFCLRPTLKIPATREKNITSGTQGSPHKPAQH